MAVGGSATNLLNKWLNVLSGTTFTAPTNTFVQLHTADPGAVGTTAVSSVTTRPTLAWNAAAAGSKSASGSPVASWAAWAGSSETVTHISLWDASSAGNFLESIALTTPKPMTPGDTLNLTSLSVAVTPVAA